MRPFSVQLAGTFHTFKLYDARGAEIMDLMAAADFAESEFFYRLGLCFQW